MPSFKDIYDLSTQVLGSGSFGEVRYATERATGKPVAVKIIDKTKVRVDYDSIIREASIMQNFSHENVIKLFGFYESKTKIYFVTELAQGGELFDHIVRRRYYSEDDARSIIKQICAALCYLHLHNVVHLDLKPENLLLYAVPSNYDDDAQQASFTPLVKLADFGLSQCITGSPPVAIVGTAGYMAPEVLKGDSYTTTPDMYSLGVITYVLLAGFLPISENDLDTLRRKVVRAEWSFPSPNFDSISPQAKDFIRRCMEANPARRITAVDALQHPWLSEDIVAVVPLAGTQAQLKRYIATLRLRAGMTAMAAAQRLQRAGSDKGSPDQ